MADVLRFLLDGPKYAEDIGANFWPDKVGYGASRGGPGSCAVAASYLLGRMRVKGWAQQTPPNNKWQITNAGHARLREIDNG